MQITFDPKSATDLMMVTAIIDLCSDAVHSDEAAAVINVPPPNLGVELDSTGCPWLEDWHAGGKNTNKDGTWKAKRGVDQGGRIAAETAARQEHAKLAALQAQGAIVTGPASTVQQPAVPTRIVTHEDIDLLFNKLASDGTVDGAKFAAFWNDHNLDPSGIGDPAQNDLRCRIMDLMENEQVMAAYAPDPAPVGIPTGIPGA